MLANEESTTVSLSQYLETPQRSRFSIPLPSEMTTIAASSILLLLSSGLLLSSSEQGLLLGVVVLGSCLGAMALTGWNYKKGTPMPLVLLGFLANAAGGIIAGSGVMFALVYWWHFTDGLILLGILSSGVCGYGAYRIFKKFEPAVIEWLYRSGRMIRPLPPDAPTVRLAPPDDPPSSTSIPIQK